jgi:hypothetical protein
MYATLSKHLDFSDNPQPKHNEYIENEWNKRDDVRLIFLANLVRMATNFAKTGDLTELEDLTYTFHIEIPKLPEPSYTTQADEDAKNLITEYFLDEKVKMLIDDGEASDDMYNDYANGDSIFHETIVDRYYSTDEAIKLLNDLYKHVEEDSGIWEGLDWEEALQAKAAYTYGNAVYAEWDELIEAINNEIVIEEIELNCTNEILKKYEWKHVGFDDEQLVEAVKEGFPDDFKQSLKENIKTVIKDLIK